jgi:hypothetical protein
MLGVRFMHNKFSRLASILRGFTMNKFARLLLSLSVPVFMLAGLAVNPAAAQDKGKDVKAVPAAKAEPGKAITKVLIDNEKVNVVEVQYRPGDVAADDRSSHRVNRTILGGTLQRIYPDGKTETIELATGTTRYNEPSKAGNYITKNIGKTDIVSLVIRLK